MDAPKNVAHEEWLMMRWKTTVLFTLQNIILGMDINVTYVTLFLYVEHIVDEKSRSLFYGIVSNAYLLASALFSAIVGRIVDKNREVRKAFLVCNAMSIIGNVLYTFQFSPWLVVTGRFLAGSGSCLRTVMNGEICRSYSPNRMPKTFALMGTAFAFGYCLLSAATSIFHHVDIRLGAWRINNLNVSGIYMSVLYASVQVISVFMLFELSRIYDLKKETIENEAEKTIPLMSSEKMAIDPPPPEEEKTATSTYNVIKMLFKTYSTCFIMMLGFFGYYGANVYESWLSMLIVKKMKGSVHFLNLVTGGIGLASVGFCTIPIFLNISGRQLYYIMIGWLVSLCLCQLIITEQFYGTRNEIFDYIMWITFCLAYGVISIANEVALANTFGAMVSSPIQTLCEGVRYSVYRLGSALALFVAPFIFPYMEIVQCIHIVIVAIISMLAIFGRKSLMNPRVVIFE